jgi:hypothetical protein
MGQNGWPASMSDISGKEAQGSGAQGIPSAVSGLEVTMDGRDLYSVQEKGKVRWFARFRGYNNGNIESSRTKQRTFARKGLDRNRASSAHRSSSAGSFPTKSRSFRAFDFAQHD